MAMVRTIHRLSVRLFGRFWALPKVIRLSSIALVILLLVGGAIVVMSQMHSSNTSTRTETQQTVVQASGATLGAHAAASTAEQGTAPAPDQPAGETAQPGATSSRQATGTSRPSISPSPFTAGCSAAYLPPSNLQPGEQWQMPAPEPRVMPRQSLQLALGQSKIGYTFASPEGLPITHVGVDYSYEGFDARGGSSQKTLQLPAGGRTFKFYTSCIVYEVQVYVNPPELRVQSVSYEAATNSIRYALNGAPESIRINYDIMGCHPDASYCSGNMVYPTGAASGVIALDPLFPEIDDYFAQYDASGVQLTLLPYRSDAETVNVGTVTFSL